MAGDFGVIALHGVNDVSHSVMSSMKITFYAGKLSGFFSQRVRHVRIAFVFESLRIYSSLSAGYASSIGI